MTATMVFGIYVRQATFYLSEEVFDKISGSGATIVTQNLSQPNIKLIGNISSLKHYQIWISTLVWNHLRDTLRESRILCVNIELIVSSQPKYRYMIMTVDDIWKVSVNSEKLIDWFEKI